MPPLSDDESTWTTLDKEAEARLTLFQKILLATDGTVTELLSLYCGRPIAARKLDQHFANVDGRNSGNEPILARPRILHRAVILEDDTGRPWLHASSSFHFDRFSAAIRQDLVETECPIGLLWRRERLEMYREVTAQRIGFAPAIATLLGVAGNAALLSRTYRIDHGGEPLGEISETFAAAVIR